MSINYVVGIAGGSASGKTLACKLLTGNLTSKSIEVVVLSQDDFYKGVPDGVNPATYNFDHPNAIDFDEMALCLAKLKMGENTEIPQYNFKTHKRSGTKLLNSAKIILVEGILILSCKKIRELLDLKLFIEASAEARVFRRIIRDVAERGRTPQDIHVQYMQFVKPAFDNYILPTLKYADMVINNEINYMDNSASIESNQIIGIKVVMNHIMYELEKMAKIAD